MKISKHFARKELLCKCGREECDAPTVADPDFLTALEVVRKACRFKFIINSWARCKFWNKKQGGAASSYHLQALAVDISCTNSAHRAKIVYELLKHGFSVVVYSRWIHADRRPVQILLWGEM